VLAVIGLGNPGLRYARTRHNAGFLVMDRLASMGGVEWVRHDLTRSHVARMELADQETWLVKPQTFMNRSGESVRLLMDHLDGEAGDLLVVVDDFLLDFARVRFRRGGSDGGHNGLASVLEALGTQQVPRLRLGIGELPPGQDAIEYVLDDFGPEQDVEALTSRGAQAVEFFAAAGLEAAMNRFNGL